ncbi:MAG: hypothetical protein HYX46_12875 [Betaproteobacteria bacterium]|nr:hypothetical protein [Betaproteobacteria bacterium]
MTEAAEHPFDREWLERVLRSTEGKCVLVGGQALAFWADRFRIASLRTRGEDAFVTRDADFLGTRESVLALARATAGHAHFPNQRAPTSLVGQIRIAAGNDAVLNIDVLHRLLGPTAEGVRRRAQAVQLGDVEFLVMHPVDVLHSRVENLARLKDKQTTEGVAQARIAAQVARAFILEVASQGSRGQRQALRAIERIAEIARTGSGKKVIRKFGVDLLAAIPAEAVTNRSFHEKRWPALRRSFEQVRKRPLGG